MKQLLMISSAIGLCLAAPAFAQTAPNQDQLNTPRATSPNTSSQTAPRATQPSSANPQQPAAGNQNQGGQAQGQQPSSPSSAQAPSNQSPSATPNQNQNGQAQNQRQPSAAGNSPTNAQAPANQQRPSTASQNQPAQNGQAQNRQSQQDMQRQDARQDRRQDQRQDQRQDARNANTDRRSNSVNVNINDTQRTRIAAVIRSGNVRPVSVDFRLATGVAVPSRVTLHTLPADIVSIVPQYRGHRYFVTGEQIVIVEPAKKTIVAVLPAGGNARASAPAANRASFTDQQRQVIRNRAPSAQGTSTTGSGASSQIVLEQEVPATIELQEFPAEVVTEVPVVRTYRYFRQDNDVVVVDPTERRVIEIIR